MNKFGLHSYRVLLQNTLKRATIVIQDGLITEIHHGNIPNADFKIIDYGDWVIMPGLIDSHVHINEPGRTEWEGFETATRAAAAGGITTLVDMPLNSSPVTTGTTALKQKINASKNKLHVHCGFYGGIIPGNSGNLQPLFDHGVLGIKAFLIHSGIDEFPNVAEQDLRTALPVIKKNNGILLVHCEQESPNREGHLLHENPTSYQAYLKSRPRKWEDDAVNLMIRLSEEFDVRIHVVHLSSSNSIKPLQAARQHGVPITVETCPQYLCINAENIPDGDTRFKCAPPIREKENNDQLWEAVRSGLIDFIVTDHSPAPPETKELESGNFEKAWGGIASLQFSLPVVWTEAQKRGFQVEDMGRLMAGNVAEFLQIHHSKGALETGKDADILIWDPEETFEVRKEDVQFRHKISPYIGQQLNGVVKHTFVGGLMVYDRGSFINLKKGKVTLRNRV